VSTFEADPIAYAARGNQEAFRQLGKAYACLILLLQIARSGAAPDCRTQMGLKIALPRSARRPCRPREWAGGTRGQEALLLSQR
jgi:hypothetical protein